MRRWTVGLVAIASLSAAVASAQPPRVAVPGRSLPPPRFGHTLDIGLVSGTVIVTPPGKQPFKLGVKDRNIPIGSLLDTTHGRVDLRAAPPPGPDHRPRNTAMLGAAAVVVLAAVIAAIVGVRRRMT